MSETYHSDEDDSRATAAEYVLGVLSSAERRSFEERLGREPSLMAEIEFWEERLSGLASGVRPVSPPPRIWTNIEQATAPPPEPDAAPVRESLWNSLSFWRPFAIGCTFATLASVGALTFFLVQPKPIPREPMLATLGTNNGQPGFVAAVNAQGNNLVIVPASLLTSGQRSMELWLIPAGDRPHSLGLIDPNRPVTINVPPELQARLTTDAALAVSLEPLGGSPTGEPTGPVLANGRLTSL
jgi:anti-sigma-K factor RskA